MSAATFHGKRVLDVGPGQCERCAARVYRVLVEEPGGGRTWHAADIGNFGYGPHRCGPSRDEPMRKAA